MEFPQKKPGSITQEEHDSLLISIEKSTSSKQWGKRQKLKILSTIPDKIAKQKIQQAWVTQQLKEVESDPLEEQVIDESGKVLASRHWKCNARSCFYQHYRGNSTKLVIRVGTSDRSKLAYNPKQHACLKHYVVGNKDKDFCHDYFKVHKQLPEGAFFNLSVQEKQAPLGIQKVPIQVPSTSSGYFETKQTEGKIKIKIVKPKFLEIKTKHTNNRF